MLVLELSCKQWESSHMKLPGTACPLEQKPLATMPQQPSYCDEAWRESLFLSRTGALRKGHLSKTVLGVKIFLVHLECDLLHTHTQPTRCTST